MAKLFYGSIILGLVIYLVILGYIYLFQRSLLYHPSVNGYMDDPKQFKYAEVKIPTQDGLPNKGRLPVSKSTVYAGYLHSYTTKLCFISIWTSSRTSLHTIILNFINFFNNSLDLVWSSKRFWFGKGMFVTEGEPWEFL